MNWYKIAKSEGMQDLAVLFGTATLVAFMGFFGYSSSQLRQDMAENPQQTIEQVQKFKEQSPYSTEREQRSQQHQDADFFNVQKQ